MTPDKPYGRYIDLFTDFGFKRIFGTERNKDILIDFLNTLLANDLPPIKTLTYLDKEKAGKKQEERKAIFDLFCEGENGEKFIIELQRAAQSYFKDRSLYYAAFVIQEQGRRGKNWDYSLTPVYSISIMDFSFNDQHPHKVISYVSLRDSETKEEFYDKLRFVYLEMPKFTKAASELQGNLDKWLFVLKNMHRLENVPVNIQEAVLLKVFEECEIAKYNKEERMLYEQSQKERNDWFAVLSTAEEKGRAKGKAEVARQCILKGYDNEIIQELTNLPLASIEQLRQEMKAQGLI
jgi:predicted transposase/invertase (TIGR01784 family)